MSYYALAMVLVLPNRTLMGLFSVSAYMKGKDCMVVNSLYLYIFKMSHMTTLNSSRANLILTTIHN